MKNASSFPRLVEPVVYKVELMVGPQNLSDAVESVSFSDMFGQLVGIWMTVVRPHADIEGVGEDFLGLGGGKEEGQEEQGEEERGAEEGVYPPPPFVSTT